MPSHTTAWLASLLALTAATTAQNPGNDYFNLTLTFSPSTNDTTTSQDAPCAGPDDNNSVTFSTYFIPADGAGGCINLADAFAGNTSRLPASYAVPSGDNGSYTTPNISFATQNRAAYDPSANYSQVIYTQKQANAQDDREADERFYATRDVYFYFGEDCMQTDDGDGNVLPWYYLSDCRSAGDCERFRYPVKSFRIYRPDEDDENGKNRNKKNRCHLEAYLGAAGTVRPSWLVGMLMMAGAGLMMAM